MPATIMLQGAGSNVGKSVLVAGLCRHFSNAGLRVRPFKPQNMSNNAAVTADGGEIGRAQAMQARGCRAETSVHMNPVLLKPESETGSQVIVQGKRFGSMRAREYGSHKAELLPRVLESFDIVGRDADLVIVEGAGSPAEVNLRAGDIANMGFAVAADVPVVMVGDIDRGGVIASLVGTDAVLDEADRALIKGFLINKFRGDTTLFAEGMPSANSVVSPRNLLIRNPLISARSASSRTASVPTRLAMTPPRSMSPTITTGTSAATANPILAISPARRLTSAGLPAPSTITRSASRPTISKLSSTRGSSSALCDPYSRARMRAREYGSHKAELLPRVLESFDIVGRDADLVIVEGAGSPAEVNLRAGDIANMGFAVAADVPVVMVGDIDRGGVIASLVGTDAVLDEADRALIKGFLINKFRGDTTLFAEGMPSANSVVSPRNLLIRNPLISARSASSRTASVPTRLAMTPPRSMSPTITTGTSAATANPILAISPARRLTSAGLPAPSTITRSASRPTISKLSSTRGSSSALCDPYSRARMLPKRLPWTITCDPVSLSGFSSTGFICTDVSARHPRACIACARPISPPSAVTAALFDMF